MVGTSVAPARRMAQSANRRFHRVLVATASTITFTE
jgi:hypothetical protein